MKHFMKIKIKKQHIILSVFILAMLVLPTHFVFADDGGMIVQFLSWVLIYVAAAFGWMLTKLMAVLNWLFKEQDFTNDGVNMGWAAARDVANMFFILILLIISFATILRRESYSMKQYLPKLLLMAVLINYSKTITLLAIDFSQVVMLTFANSFAGTQSSFVQMLQLNKLTALAESNDVTLGDTEIFYGIILYVLFIMVAFFIMIMLIGILIMRMVMFWVLIVLSPLAFMAYAMPGGGKYFSQWLGDLTKYLVVGPVLAFFTWLSMVTMKAASTVLLVDISNTNIAAKSTDITDAGNIGSITSFILAIGMLVGTIKITQSVGAAGGAFGANMASNFKNKGINLGKKTATFGRDKIWQGTKIAGNAGGRATLGLARTVDRGLGAGTASLFGKTMQGGLVGTGIKKTSNLFSGRTFRNASMNKFEADKARFDQQATRGKLKYQGREYTKTADGRFMHDDGTYAKRKNIFGKEVELKEMSKVGASHFMATASAKGNAMAAAKMATDAKIAEAQKKINAIGMSDEMKHQRLKDSSTSEAEKQAIALDLAENAGFKNKTHDDVKLAKAVLGSNQILLKKFNDSIDKKFAHLNYDMKTEEGREAFKTRLDKGKIDDVMDKSAYGKDYGQHVLRAVQELKGPAGFNKYVNRVGESSFHKKELEEGLKTAAGKEFVDAKGALAPMRASLVELTGNIGDAIKGMDISTDKAKMELQGAIDNLFQNLSVKQKANLSTDNFNVEKMAENFGGNRIHAQKAVDAIRLAINSNMSQKDIEAVRRHPDSSNGLVKEMESSKTA